MPADRFRYGLYRCGALVGVAVFSHPTNERTLTGTFGGAATDSVELGRLVLLDEVPSNGETWFLARAFARLKERGLRGVLSFSDPTPRERLNGPVVFPGHVGFCYQALNAKHLGRGKARTLRLLPDATTFSDRAISKIRSMERGREYSANILVRWGAEPPPAEGEWKGWLKEWLPRLTRPLRHRGNFKYAWWFGKAPKTAHFLPYPKRTDPCFSGSENSLAG
jgi:hypothetical protein